MKKKFLITLMAIVCVLACTFSLVACGGDKSDGGNDTDITSQTAEFIAYRKKVTAVIKDNGMFINDFDGAQAARSHSSAHSAVKAAAHSSEPTGIAEAVMSDANKQNSIESIVSMRDDLFEQTFCISLLLGDGISTYYNEKNFYNISVKFDAWQQYFDVTKNNNTDYVRCYMPQGFFDDKELFMVAYIDYTSITDYTWTFLQYTYDFSDTLYVHGTSQKEFLCVSRSTGNPDNNYLYYAQNNTSGYESRLKSSVDTCYQNVQSYFSMMPQEEMRSIKNAKYTITEQQQTALSKKYFEAADETSGMIYAEKGGIRYGETYIASDEKEVVIPDACEYLSEDFEIVDTNGCVEKLTIPASVKGIARVLNRETGDEYVAPKILSGNEIAESEYFLRGVRLKEIEVKAGSPLFKAGKGHLYTVSDELVTIADKPIGSTLCVSDYSRRILDLFKELGEEYPSLFSQVTEMAFSVPCDDVSVMELSRYMPQLSRINVAGNLNSEHRQEYDLPFYIDNDVSLNISVEGASDCWGGSCFRFGALHRDGAQITVNMLGRCPIPNFEYNGVQERNHIVVLNMSKISYEILFGEFYEQFYIDYIYSEDALSNFELIGSGGEIQLRLASDFSASAITVPAEVYGKTVIMTEFDIVDIVGKTLTLTVPESVDIHMIVRNRSIAYDTRRFTLAYGGTYDQLKTMLDPTGSYEQFEDLDISFTAKCSDKTDDMQFGLIYSSNTYTVHITYNGETHTAKVPKRESGEGIVHLEKFIDVSSDLTYFYQNEAGYVRLCEDMNNPYIRVPLTRDSNCTVFSHANGLHNYDLEDEKDEYSLSVAVLFSDMEARAKIIGGTVLGSSVFIENGKDNVELSPEASDREKFDFLQGIECQLFEEFELCLQAANGEQYSIRAKITMDENSALHLVYCQKVHYDVTVTLYDNSILNYTLKPNERIPFDAQTWKIESGYAYYIVSHGENGDITDILQVENGSVYRYGENIELKRIKLFDSLPVSLSGEDYTVSGSLALQNGESAYSYVLVCDLSGTIRNSIFEYKASSEYFFNDIGDIMYLADAIDDCSQWREILVWTLQTQIDANGVLSVTGLDYEWSMNFSNNSKDIWNVSIENGKATVNYTVMDDDGLPSADYGRVFERAVEIRDFSDADLANALRISQEIMDKDGNIYTETLYICLQVTFNPDNHTISFEYVSYKKEVTP